MGGAAAKRKRSVLFFHRSIQRAFSSSFRALRLFWERKPENTVVSRTNGTFWATVLMLRLFHLTDTVLSKLGAFIPQYNDISKKYSGTANKDSLRKSPEQHQLSEVKRRKCGSAAARFKRKGAASEEGDRDLLLQNHQIS